ncbi:NAD-binding protein [Nocardioides islandensis]|uniref:NAD-binding protein n=1 Tax=Nocardioides islandensis TaxID=433663 RepID=A0A930V8N1_9ACTN|nr:NAD-binding protein [Nocardioides islandensis]MBF4762949.1 NAD-binding protein [Nocardioides islandensis]
MGLFSARRRWHLLAFAWVVLIILGYGGFVEQSRAADLGRGFLDNLYLTLQLAVLSYGDSGGDLNWRLEIARFAAPLMATGTLVQAASVVFRENFQRFRLGHFRGHTVVCGLGISGARLALALQSDGRKVVGVDPDPNGVELGALRAREVPVLVGDPKDPEVLRAVRIDRASSLVALCKSDSLNVAIAAAARGIPRTRRAVDLRCSVHLEDAELTQFLRGSGIGGHDVVRIEFFNMHERAARALVAEHVVLEKGTKPHLVVIGLGQLGRAIVLSAAQQWSEVGEGPLVATLVDREAPMRWQAMEMQHPGLVDAVDAVLLTFDVEAPTRAGLSQFTDRLEEIRPTVVAIMLDDESTALATGLYLHATIDDETVPVVVRTRGDEGLSDAVEDDQGNSRFPGLRLFPMLDRACSPALIDGGVREELARALYADHLARAAARGVEDPAWADLSDDEREAGRDAADGLIDALHENGFELLPLRHWGAAPVELTPEETDRMAERDHDRWRARRGLDGWRYSAVRDAREKVTPQLVPYTELRPEWVEYNITRIQAMPGILARAGLEVRRG